MILLRFRVTWVLLQLGLSAVTTFTPEVELFPSVLKTRYHVSTISTLQLSR